MSVNQPKTIAPNALAGVIADTSRRTPTTKPSLRSPPSPATQRDRRREYL
jgi:hypothetical protein